MLLEFQTPFVEVANLHHETPTDMPSIDSAFSLHDILICRHPTKDALYAPSGHESDEIFLYEV